MIENLQQLCKYLENGAMYNDDVEPVSPNQPSPKSKESNRKKGPAKTKKVLESTTEGEGSSYMKYFIGIGSVIVIGTMISMYMNRYNK